MEAETLWKAAVGELQLQVTPDIFEMYLQPLRAIDLSGGVLRMACPNQFVVDWMTLRLGRAVTKTVRYVANEEIEIRYESVEQGQLRLGGVALDKLGPGGGEAVLVMAGKLRDPGFVMLWHDLRTFYGPVIGLGGVGLWAELRASIQAGPGHPMNGFGWLSVRTLEECYNDGRVMISGLLKLLVEAKLVRLRTGAELVAIWQRNRAAGVPDARNRGLSPQVLARFLGDPVGSRVYVVHDPLQLPQFCARFGHAVRMAGDGWEFVGYAARITARWREWLSGLAAAVGVVEFASDYWLRSGLVSEQDISEDEAL